MGFQARRNATPTRLGLLIESYPKALVLKLRFFVEWPTAFLNIASGQRPWTRKAHSHLGQRPSSIQNVWVDVGRWPTNFPSFSIPGAMPLASLRMAVGQQNPMPMRNVKKR